MPTTHQDRATVMMARVRASIYEENETPVAIQDLLSDVRHYCDKLGYSFGDIDGRAYQNYVEEVAEDKENRPQHAIQAIADRLPTQDEWESAADFMEHAAAILDRFGYTDLRPAHYEE